LQAVIIGVSKDIDIFTYHDQCSFRLKCYIIDTTLFYGFEYLLCGDQGTKLATKCNCGYVKHSICAIKLLMPLSAIKYMKVPKFKQRQLLLLDPGASASVSAVLHPPPIFSTRLLSSE